MNITSILGTLAAVAVGVALAWFKEWASGWFARNEVRGAVRAEISGILITLNFFIMAAMDEGAGPEVVEKYFPVPPSLESFKFYWNEKRDRMLKLPEWPRLKSWNENLAAIANGPHSPLFSAIMLLQSLLLSPLDECVDRGSRRFIQRILDRPAVSTYQSQYFTDYGATR